MAKLSTGQQIAVGGAIGVMVLVVVALIVVLNISSLACLAILLMNVILPLFDVNYPLTWVQAYGVGGACVIVRIFFVGICSKE
ncbi:MAG: hypothetical protein MN733_39835 [Nitrososphaera sp.]|nr:hypothetical protein [Nitrososphaera sp.]